MNKIGKKLFPPPDELVPCTSDQGGRGRNEERGACSCSWAPKGGAEGGNKGEGGWQCKDALTLFVFKKEHLLIIIIIIIIIIINRPNHKIPPTMSLKTSKVMFYSFLLNENRTNLCRKGVFLCYNRNIGILFFFSPLGTVGRVDGKENGFGSPVNRNSPLCCPVYVSRALSGC